MEQKATPTEFITVRACIECGERYPLDSNVERCKRKRYKDGMRGGKVYAKCGGRVYELVTKGAAV